jgi:thiamine pyrophosphate-dependent acetolactate synthase large subunit-like protein
VIGIGHFNGYPTLLIRRSPSDLFLPWGYGIAGCALAVAIGASIARPEETTVLVEGDGSLMMSLAELETAARIKAPLAIIVMDDSSYSSETYLLERSSQDPGLSCFDPVDFARVAASLGVTAYRAQSADELRVALPKVLSGTLPALVHVTIDKSIRHEEKFRAIFDR